MQPQQNTTTIPAPTVRVSSNTTNNIQPINVNGVGVNHSQQTLIPLHSQRQFASIACSPFAPIPVTQPESLSIQMATNSSNTTTQTPNIFNHTTIAPTVAPAVAPTVAPTTVPVTTPATPAVAPIATPVVIPTTQDSSFNQQTQPSGNNQNTVSVNPTTGILLHHEDQSHYVLSQYCMPVRDSFVSSEYPCKWGDRSCIVFKSNLTVRGQAIPTLSPSVFSPCPDDVRKSKYSIMDVRMAKCFYPNCVDSSKSKPKVFHHVCYMNSLTLKTNPGFKMVSLENAEDPLIEMIPNHQELQPILSYILSSGTKLIFPLCSKRCFNYLNDAKQAIVDARENKTKKPSKRNSKSKPDKKIVSANWDNDGVNGKRSSVEVVINWLTTEENCNSYYGGADKNGRTSATRREGYHQLLSKMIEKENGSVRSPDSIKSKITRIMDSFKEAEKRINTTGMGLPSWELPSFKDHVRDTVCRYYYDLEDVLKDRPNVRPWYTNFMTGEDEEDENDDESTGFEHDENIMYSSNMQEMCKGNDNECIEIDMDERTSTILPNNKRTTNNANFNSNTTSSANTMSNNESSNTSSLTGDDGIPSCVSIRSQKRSKNMKTTVTQPTNITNDCHKANKTNTISPIKAKSIQRKLFQEKKKQISGNNKKSKISDWNQTQQSEHDYFVECRETKIRLEKERYDYEKELNLKKLELEKQRLNIESESSLLKKQQIKLDEERFKRENDESNLKKEHLKVQTDLEKSKIRLTNIEVFKARMALKKENPELSDELLDQYCPLL